MKASLRTLAAFSLLALANAGAYAGTDTQRVEIDGSPAATALAAAPGMYLMSNGKILSLTRSSSGVFAQLDKGNTKELMLVDRNRLRSRDGRMEVAVEIDNDGEVRNVKMSLARG